MANVTFDLTTVSDEQLVLFSNMFPEEVLAEIERRSTFETMDEGLTALAAAQLHLETLVSNHGKSSIVQALRQHGVTNTINKVLATARRLGFNFELPELSELPNLTDLSVIGEEDAGVVDSQVGFVDPSAPVVLNVTTQQM